MFIDKWLQPSKYSLQVNLVIRQTRELLLVHEGFPFKITPTKGDAGNQEKEEQPGHPDTIESQLFEGRRCIPQRPPPPMRSVQPCFASKGPH